MLLNVTIREATPQDLDAIRTLLLAARLPAGDLDSSPIEFLVAVAGDSPVGVIGLERFSSADCCVRSPSLLTCMGPDWAARWSMRWKLVRSAGVVRLALLTETAVDFFRTWPMCLRRGSGCR